MKKIVKRAVSFCMCGAMVFTSNVSTLTVFANTLDEATSSVDTSLDQVPEALTGSPVVFEEEPVKLELTLGEEKDVKEYFDNKTNFKEIVWEIPEELKPNTEDDVIVTGEENHLKAKKVGKTEIEAKAKDDKENVLQTFEVTVIEDESPSADTSSEPAEDVDIPDEDLPADEPDETSQANAPPVVSSATSEESTSSISEALLFDENGVPLDRAAIAKVLKGFPLVNPAASGLKGAYTGGTASLCEYDFEGHGYSFPSNFPVPYFAGHSASKWVALALYRSDTDMQHAYCIEFGRDAYYGTTYSAANTWGSLSNEQRKTLGLILSYGFTPDVKLSDYFDGTMERNLHALIATQCAIWMTVSGNWNSPYREQIINTFAANNGGQYGATKAYFDQLAYKVNSFMTLPSYASMSAPSAPTYELTYNSATGKYETTLTDTAGASGFTFTMAGVDFVQDGNKLKISTSNPNISGVASASKSVPASDAMIALYWTGNNSQSLATAKNGQPDPVQAYFKLQVTGGNIDLIKTSEDGIVEGIQFTIKNVDTGAVQVATTDATGHFNVAVSAGNYEVAEIYVPGQYVVPPPVPVTVKAGETTKVTFNNVLRPGKAKIVKTSEDGVVEGLEFAIAGTATNGTKVNETAVTDKDGTILKELPAGRYVVTEVNVPSRYVAPAPQNIVVKAGETAEVEFYNSLNDSKTKIIKTSDDGVVEGVKFQITGENYDKTFTTDKYGAITTDLTVGTYTIKELQVSDRYVTPPAQTVTIESGKTAVVKFHNTLKPGKAKIVKTSDDGIIEGLKFSITGTATDGTTVNETVTTDKNGTILKEVPAGTYTVKEVQTPSRYTAPAAQTITVKPNETATVSFHNVLNGGKAQIVKTSDDGIVKGMKFSIVGTATNGTKVNETVVTGEDGTILKEVPAGTYTVSELQIPSRYVAPKSQTVTVKPNETATVKFHNALNNGETKIIKTSDDGIVENVKFHVTGTATNGTKIDKTYTTDKNGVISTDLPAGSFTVTELEVADRYVTPKAQTITVKPNETASVTFHNSLKDGKAKIVKTSEDGIVANIKFKIAGTATNGTKIDTTVTTGADGTIVKDIAAGTYTVSELEVADRYVSPAAQTITVKPNETAEVSFHNELENGKAKIIKKSDDGVVANIKFKIAGTATNGTKIDTTVTTGADGTIVKDIAAGTYTVSELEIADRYVAPAPQTITVKPNETASVTFKNVLKNGKAKIVKTSDDGIIKDVKFNIAGTAINGTEVNETVVTGEDGTILKEVPAGTFTVTELEVNSRYVTPKAQTITVKPDETATVSFHNALKNGKAKIIKTSDDGIITGVKFSIVGTATNGAKVDVTVVTGEDGTILKEVPAGTYAVSELEVADRYVAPAPQTVTVKPNETAEVSFHNALQNGKAKIVKTSDDGIVKDVKFNITGTAINGTEVNETVVTGEDGTILKEVPAGTFTVTELEVAGRYVTPKAQTITVKPNETATVSFHNALKAGKAKIIKTSDDGIVKGVKFSIVGTAINGTAVNETVITGEDGTILKEVPAGTFAVTELEVAGRYVTPKAQTITVNPNEVATVKFHNALQNGKAKIIKTSDDGIIKDVKFNISGTAINGTEVNETVVTGEDGTILKEVPAGTFAVTELEVAGRYVTPKAQTVTVKPNETATVSFHNALKDGKAKIIKTSDDGIVKGVKFSIVGTAINGTKVNETVVTGEDGTILKVVPAGSYAVTELEVNNRYVTPKAQTITVKPDETAEVSFHNTLKPGTAKIIKVSEDGIVKDVKFSIVGTSITGKEVNETVVTNDKGEITKSIEEGRYTITELAVADRYVTPTSQTVDVKATKTTTVTFNNKLKYFDITLTKQDAETGKAAQGDAKLDGAVYGLYKGDTLVEKLTIKNGTASSGQHVCGDDYYIQEITPPTGYQLDSTKYPVDAKASNFTGAKNPLNLTVKDNIIKGKISVQKLKESIVPDGNGTDLEGIPEEGAVFQLWLKSAGSYDKAKDSEKDTLTTDATGLATSKLLPYGTYTVHQVSGADGRELVADFDVLIGENNKVYTYSLTNKIKTSAIKIIKKDAETKEVIPLAGTAFKVKSMATGNWITVNGIDTFYTDNSGQLMLPVELPYGKYELHEVTAPHGYVLADKIPFTVDGKDKTITLTCYDTAQKGQIHVEKTGENFSSVYVKYTESGKIYQPVYETGAQAGAEYDIIAAEDIVTADGTIRAKKGDVVDHLTTTSSGATSKELYLGKYEVKETKAPDGFVLNGKSQIVTLSYAGQDVEVILESATFYNERQKVEISLLKQLEHDELYSIGMNEEYTNVRFGLFAAEEIKAADGKVIQKNGLIEVQTIDADGKLLFTTDLPFGKYFVQEIATDDHYVLDDTKYPFEFKYGGQDKAVIEIKVNDGEAVENNLKRGKIDGLKVGESEDSLEGAVIGLFAPDTAEFTEDTAYLVDTSDEDGRFEFNDVPYGDYVVREITPPTGYILSDTSYPVTVAEDGETIEVTVTNELIRGNVHTTKVDEEYPDNKLTGAVFDIYKDVDGDGKFDADIDEKVATMNESEDEAGEYYANDLTYGQYLLHEEEAPYGFLADEGYYPFEIVEDGVTVTVENEAGVGFTNKPGKGSLELTKKDVSTGAPLPDAGFRIWDSEGNIVAEGRTDKDGVAKFDELRIGDYFYQEFDAPKGYEIDESKFPFSIKEDGEIVKCVMTNRPKVGEVDYSKPDQPISVKTGDTNQVFPLLCVVLSSLGMLILAVRLYKMKSRKEDDK